MEQRIGANSQTPDGAGLDPAFIPGLTSPVSANPKDTEPADRVPEQGVPADVVEEETGPEAAEAADDAEAGTDDDTPEGPVFEAADRRARIVADHRGIRLRLDEEACEFRWDEIGAVETESPRFGKRYTVTVHTPDRRWYPIEIEAASRSRFKEWDDRLDAVLDAYFEDSDESAEPDEAPEAEDAAKAEESSKEESSRTADSPKPEASAADEAPEAEESGKPGASDRS